MSRDKSRQDLALEYGATNIISERGEANVARIKELTKGIGADAVLECVGTQQSMHQAIQCAGPGAMTAISVSPRGSNSTRSAAVFLADRDAGRSRAGASVPAASD